jgi:thioredoxin-dependent peroxiredoxin
MKLAPGDVAPNFSLLDSNNKKVSLKDFAGKTLILYVYPAALTPGCSKQACDFRDTESAWRALGYEVVGISPDSPTKLKEFEEKESLPFLLLSDSDKEVMKSYGAFGEKQMYGRTVVGVIRSTFVIKVNNKGQGKIEQAMYAVKATGHVARLARDLNF